MKRTCEACGRTYNAKTTRSRYCTNASCRRKRTRQRVREARRSNVVQLPTRPTAAGDSEPASEPPEPRFGAVEFEVRRELEKAAMLESSIGQSAIALARRLDAGIFDTGSSLAAVAKQLRALMAEALQHMKIPDDPVDELRARRRRRVNGA